MKRKHYRLIIVVLTLFVLPLIFDAFLKGNYPFALFFLGITVLNLANVMGPEPQYSPMNDSKKTGNSSFVSTTTWMLAGFILALSGGLIWYMNLFIQIAS